MHQKQPLKSAKEDHLKAGWQAFIVKDVLLTFSSVVLAVLVNFISLYSSKSWSSAGPNVIPRLSIFLLALFLLTMIIVSIASFIRRKNRDVILLKERLGEIYLSALRKSALNPLLESTSHD